MMTRAYFSRLVISTQYVDLPLSGLKRHTAFTKTNTFPPPRERGRSRLGFWGANRQTDSITHTDTQTPMIALLQ